MVLSAQYQDVRVVALHVSDGEVIIGRYDNLDLITGDWKNAEMVFDLPKVLNFGLDISVKVEFVGERSVSFSMKQGYIDFSGAGACFVDPRLEWVGVVPGRDKLIPKWSFKIEPPIFGKNG